MTRMPLFSNNPGLERMMQQKPTGRRVPEPPALPPDHPCYGCNYALSWLTGTPFSLVSFTA